MFLQNKYTRWYNSIIERAKPRTKFKGSEWHHPIPKSLGGDPKIGVYLTTREHLICHLMLVRMLEGEAKMKMAWALHRMLFSANKQMNRYRPSSRTYAAFREMFYSRLRGKKLTLTDEHRANIAKANSARKGRKESEETRAKHRANRTGSTLSESHKAAISRGHVGKIMTDAHRENIRKANLGRKMTEEAKEKISLALKKRPKKQISVNGVMYPSCDDAAEKLGLKYSTLYNHARSPSKPEIFFI